MMNIRNMMSQENHAFVGPLTTSCSSRHPIEDTMSREIDDLVIRFQKLSLNDCEANQSDKSTVFQSAFVGAPTTSRSSVRTTPAYTESEDIEDLILRFQKLSLNDHENDRAVTSTVVRSNLALGGSSTIRHSSAYRAGGITVPDEIGDTRRLRLPFTNRGLSFNGCATNQTVPNTVLLRNSGVFVGPCTTSLSFEHSVPGEIEDVIQRFQRLSLYDSKTNQTISLSTTSYPYQSERSMNINMDWYKDILMRLVYIRATYSNKREMSPKFLRKLKRMRKKYIQEIIHGAQVVHRPQELIEWEQSAHKTSGGPWTYQNKI